MNTYETFFNSRRITVHADTSYEAQQKAAKEFRLKNKHYRIIVMLVEKDGEEVTHSTAAF